MRIIASNVRLSSAHLYEVRDAAIEQFRVAVAKGPSEAAAHGEDKGFRVRRDHADAKLERLLERAERYLRRRDDAREGGRIDHRIERLLARIDRLKAEIAQQAETRAPEARVEFRRESVHTERELTRVTVSGAVLTADGRAISIDRALELSRAYARRETISLAGSGPLTRPGDGVVSTQPVGTPEGGEPEPNPAAGEEASNPVTRQGLALGGSVLPLDLDADGAYSSDEIVGQNGDAFAALRALDEDGNGFLDEGDSAFARLALIDRDEGGLTATSLGDRGVGAIYTGSVASPFRFTDANNETTAELSRSGFYLNEDGSTGFVHQLDVVV
ncbi:MAG: hypothetical protein AB7R55_04855 [Gemmatimonadales bacterium]